MGEPTVRIGELADLAGVSTRTVRHYHQIGLLPEPQRLPNGYRSYGLRHVVGLLRIRRLIDLGLSLEEVRDALADEGDEDLREVLAERERDLAAEAERIEAQRANIAVLLARADDLREPESVAELMGGLKEIFGGEHPALERDQMIFEFFDAMIGPESVSQSGYTRKLLEDRDLATGLAALATRFEALAELEPDHPEVEAIGAEVAKLIARFELDMAEADVAPDPAVAQGFLKALRADLSPAQRRCLGLWFPGSGLAEALE